MGDLLARPLRSLLSPPPKGPVCVGSIQPPRTLGEHKRPQAVPAKTARPADDRRAWRNNSGRRGAGTPLPGPGADLNPRPRGREQSLAPTSSAFGPSPLQGKRARIQVRPAEASTISPRRHTATPSQDGKTGQRGPGHGSEHNHSVASYSPCGTRGQRKRPERHPAPRDKARPRRASLSIQAKREQDASRPGDGAPARPATSPRSTDSGGLAKPRSLA